MCGLIGAFGEINERTKIALGYLGNLCSLRGSDSTGYFDLVPNLRVPEQIKYAKTLEDPVRFFAPGERYWGNIVSKRWKKHDPRIFAVHTRLATIGDVTRENAHPFHHGHILGMHNGTIRYGLDGQDKFKTDSECLYWNLSTKGNEFLEDLARKASAAYAMVWLDTKTKTLNLYRNNERPLSLWLTNDKKTLIWASDKYWLEGVLPNLGLRGYPEPLPVDELWSFDYTSDKMEVTKEKVRRFFPLHNGSPARSTAHGSGESALAIVPFEENKGRKWNYKYECWLSDEEAALRDGVEFNKAREAAKRPDVEGTKRVDAAGERWPSTIKGQETWFHGYRGVYHSEESYKMLLANGCRGCNKTSHLYESVEFLSEKDYVCQKCKYDDIILDLVIAEIEEERKDQKVQVENEVASWH